MRDRRRTKLFSRLSLIVQGSSGLPVTSHLFLSDVAVTVVLYHFYFYYIYDMRPEGYLGYYFLLWT